MDKTALLVTTAQKGVFFGYGVPSTEPTIRLERARMAVRWASEVHGVLGLAVTGPTQDCKIGPAVPAITLHNVTAVVEVASAAVGAWENEPWA